MTPTEVADALSSYRRRALVVTRAVVLPLDDGGRMAVLVADRRHRDDIRRVSRVVDRGANPVPVVTARLLSEGEPAGLVLDVEIPAPAAWRFALLLELPRQAALVAAIADLGGLVVAPPEARTADDAIRFGATLPLDGAALTRLLADAVSQGVAR